MPTLPPHLQPQAMPEKAEIIITWTDGMVRHYSTNALTSISLPMGKDHYTVDVFDGRPIYQSEPQEFTIEGWHWECVERRPNVAMKKVHQLIEGDHVKDYGKVVEIGPTRYIGNEAVKAVSFEDRPPAVFKSHDPVTLVPPHKVELTDEEGDMTLIVMPSIERGDKTYLSIRGLVGIHVDREELIKALQLYAPSK